ncbi:hypothetical protein DU18_0911 [Chlamydia muridarum]|nr:hypothetical protein DU18_0911 [Chlamydia muridarum]
MFDTSRNIHTYPYFFQLLNSNLTLLLITSFLLKRKAFAHIPVLYLLSLPCKSIFTKSKTGLTSPDSRGRGILNRLHAIMIFR